jgi:small subunit ribosomal protein S8e
MRIDMTLWQGESRRKKTGGRKVYLRKKRKFELGSDFKPAVIGEEDVKRSYDGRGGKKKFRVTQATYANVIDPKTNQSKKVKILSVKDNPSDPHYVQRNIITKGAAIQTDIGIARVTSRPGRDGVINAVLVEGD